MQKDDGRNKMTIPAGLKSIAIALPQKKYDNYYWVENWPQLVERETGWLWKRNDLQNNRNKHFNEQMANYVDDIFRGARYRYFLDHDETVFSLELKAAEEALKQAQLTSSNIDLLISTSFLADQVGEGSSAYLAKALDLQHSAWNMESACSSFTVAYDTAVGLVQSGRYKNILVVTSCCYSKNVDLNTPLAFGIGDAAVSIVVSADTSCAGYLGGCNRHSAETIGSVSFETSTSRETGNLKHYLTPHGEVARERLRDMSEPLLKHCVEGALIDAQLNLDDLDYFIFNSPMAWYTEFCVKTLGISPEKTHNIFPYYTNIGSSLPGVSLYHAAYEGKILQGDKVLIYTVGSVSSCMALILEWGDTNTGRLPVNAPKKIEVI
jgi:3-oxoacyl-[acyl-carrier-protein] synthase-3